MSLKTFEEQVEFLRSLDGVKEAHSQGSLMEHLIGTREILIFWKASPELCAAGLFHSIYGTESFPVPTIELQKRDIVRGLIGLSAEEIVYVFCAMTGESFEANLKLKARYKIHDRFSCTSRAIGPRMFRQLCDLSAANWLEQQQRLSLSFRRLGHDKYYRMLKFLTPDAAEAIKATCLTA